MRRALAAWFKTGGTEMPSGTSGIKMHQGRAVCSAARLKWRAGRLQGPTGQ